ncbi:MAG: hypothetical protein MK200_07975, partial [Nitrosopumilus sp.]|nr:hypothetical protein [Nitrosopumilus sp.]
PQEKPLTNEDVSNIYRMIKEQIREGRKKGQSIMVFGDFNCKVGEVIKEIKRKCQKEERNC